jgi:integrase
VLLDAGSNIKTVQTRLGHSTPAITMALYVHPVDERDAEDAAHVGKLIGR